MTTKRKAKQSDMRSDQRHHDKYGNPRVPVTSKMPLHWSACGYRQRKMEAADAHWAFLDAA
jgi:hypothetical protein